jgi:hypothetical protein
MQRVAAEALIPVPVAANSRVQEGEEAPELRQALQLRPELVGAPQRRSPERVVRAR